jgi:hypothetical protein
MVQCAHDTISVKNRPVSAATLRLFSVDPAGRTIGLTGSAEPRSVGPEGRERFRAVQVVLAERGVRDEAFAAIKLSDHAGWACLPRNGKIRVSRIPPPSPPIGEVTHKIRRKIDQTTKACTPSPWRVTWRVH